MFSKRSLFLIPGFLVFALVLILIFSAQAQDGSDLVPPEVILPSSVPSMPAAQPVAGGNTAVSGGNSGQFGNSSGIIFGQPGGWGFDRQGSVPSAPVQGAYTNYRGLQPGVNMTMPGQQPVQQQPAQQMPGQQQPAQQFPGQQQPGAGVMQSGPFDATSKDCPLCEKKKLEGQKLTNDGPGSNWGQVMPKADPVALIQTTKGPIIARLFRQYVPGTVNNFIELSQLGFYNGLRFHRVEPGFVIQSGCPKGDGTGGYNDPKTGQERRLPLELHQALHHNAPGVLAMARFGNDLHSASSQFYITLSALPRLDSKYTVFGGVIQGMDVVNRITTQDRIVSVQIQE